MLVILGIAVAIVLMTIGTGIAMYRSENKMNKKKNGRILKTNVAAFAAVIVLFLFVFAPNAAFAASEGGAATNNLGFMSAALATGLAAIGAGYAVAVVGSAALGALSENSKNFGKILIFVGLAEGIAIYGLITSILIIGRL